jgi:hypothetical protein
MDEVKLDPIFEARPLKSARGWFVVFRGAMAK